MYRNEMEAGLEQLYQIKVDGETREYSAHTTYGEIARKYQKNYDSDILIAEINGKLKELFNDVEESGELIFHTRSSAVGMKAYRRSAILLMAKAFHDLTHTEKEYHKLYLHVLFTMDQAYYCEVYHGTNVSKPEKIQLKTLENTMKEMVKMDFPIRKRTVSIEKAQEIFARNHEPDKSRLFHFRRSSRVNIYMLDGYEDYYYGYMVPSTGYLKHFSIEQHGNGFLLNFPSEYYPEKVDHLDFQPKLFDQLLKASQWAANMDVATVGALNDKITFGQMQNMVLAQEVVQEHRLSEIAQQIASSGKIKFVMVAGPSSSGKTTFSHRLSIELYAHGYKPHPISLDDFFVNREDMVPKEDGSLDYEELEAVDVEEFNSCMTRLLAGEEVDLPTFDFKEGRKKYGSHKLKIGSDEILVIEGIHGLNPKMSYALPDESKFRIYISALTAIKLDEQNCISTRDGRLLRRLIRDARTRGASAQETLARWDSVKRGEEDHIFPFQEEADVMFNSSMIFELSVLKPYVEPLLFSIPKEAAEYHEAKRLLKFFDYCLAYPADGIAKNSIIREFIGGSCFNV